MFPTKRSFVPRSPGTLNQMLSSNFVSFNTSMMSHMYSLTKNPTPPDPLSLGFCPSRFFPIHAYSLTLYPISTPSFSHDSWIPTISRSRSLTFSATSSRLRSSVANPHTFHDPIFNFLLKSFLTFFLSVVFFSSFLHLFLLSFPSPALTCSCFSFPPFTRGLRLRFAIPLAMHTLHPTLLTHADTLLVSILSHSLLALFLSVTRKCSPSLSTSPFAKQYSPISLHFFLNSILVISLRTPNTSTTSTLPVHSFLLHPPFLTVALSISLANISSFSFTFLVVGCIQVTGISQS